MADETTDVDSLAGKIAAALGRMGGGGGSSDDDGDGYDDGRRPRSVPYDRLQREIDKRRAAESALSDLGGQVEGLMAARTAELATFRESTATELKRIQGGHNEDLALVDLGVTDPLGRTAVRSAWSTLPKDGRGKSPSEWWGGLSEAHKAHAADSEQPAPKVPRTLAAYLPQVDTSGGGKGGAQTQARKPPPGGPGKRQIKGVDGVPIDQGMDAFFAGLRGLS